MFKVGVRKNRSAKHTHEYRAHGAGADLQRRVCAGCRQVSIETLPPTSLRSTTADSDPGLFAKTKVTVVIDEVVEPVGLSWRFGERRARR